MFHADQGVFEGEPAFAVKSAARRLEAPTARVLEENDLSVLEPRVLGGHIL